MTYTLFRRAGCAEITPLDRDVIERAQEALTRHPVPGGAIVRFTLPIDLCATIDYSDHGQFIADNGSVRQLDGLYYEPEIERGQKVILIEYRTRKLAVTEFGMLLIPLDGQPQ